MSGKVGLRKDYIGFYKPEKAFGFYSKSNVKHCCSVAKLYLTLLRPRGLEPASPLSMGSPRQEYWSWLPFPSPGALPNPGIEHGSPGWAGGFFTMEPPGKPNRKHCWVFNKRAVGCGLNLFLKCFFIYCDRS